MISKLKKAGHELTNEQQVQAVIRSLSYSWEYIKVHFTHNKEIKTFEDTVRHLELEENRLESSKPEPKTYVADAGVQNN